MLQIFIYITLSIFTIGGPALLIILLKEQLKYSVKTVCIIYGLYFFTGFLVDMMAPDSSMMALVINTICLILPAIIFKANLVNSYVFWFCIITIMNVAGNLMTVIVVILPQLINGGSVEWFNMNDATFTVVLFVAFSLVAAMVISYFVGKRIKNIVMNMKGVFKYFVFIFGVGVWAVNSLMKPVIDLNYNKFPIGIPLFLDAVCFIVGSISIVVLYALHIRESRAENRIIKREIEMEEERYRKTLVLQKQLRILNHEVRNYLNAGNSEIKSNIDDYCNTILKELESMD